MNDKRTNLQRELERIEEKNREEKARKKAENEQNYIEYLKRKNRLEDKYRKQIYRKKRNGIPTSIAIIIIILFIAILIAIFEANGIHIIDSIKYIIETMKEGY